MNKGLAGFPKRQPTSGIELIDVRRVRRGNTEAQFRNICRADFDDYLLLANGVTVGTSGATVSIQVSKDGGANWEGGTGYSYSAFIWTHSPTGAFGNSVQSGMPILHSDELAGWSNDGEMNIYCEPNAWTSFTGWNNGRDNNRGANDPSYVVTGGNWRSTESVNAFRVLVSTGIMLTGMFSLYGYVRGAT